MKRKRQPQTCGTPSTKRKIALAQRRALKQHNCISYLHVDFNLLHAIVLDATNKIQGHKTSVNHCFILCWTSAEAFKKKMCLFRGVSALRPFLILPFKAKRQLFPYYSATAIRKRQIVKGVAKVVYNRVIVVEPLCFIATLFFTHIFISWVFLFLQPAAIRNWTWIWRGNEEGEKKKGKKKR